MSQQYAHTSEWTFKQKAARALWMIVQASLFRWSWHNMYAWRRFLLRLFGARVGRAVRIRPTARVEIPWNIDLADGVVIGDFVTLYSLGNITIGEASMVSQHSYLCAGSHDHTSLKLPLLKPPITLGRDVWIAADVFVGPGVTIGDRTVVGARSSVPRDLPAGIVAVGNPATAIKLRQLQE
ncbi:MAG: colanic acid biosynthesis acetyltransferase WcaF [Burkholderiales bacterium]|nr:colanic acid biosynthesis acetyltransferase WcaF [Phycisphaerae bacterium]